MTDAQTADDAPNLGRPVTVKVERAAHSVISAGYGRHDSAFTPGRPVWTSENADELKRLFVDRPDVTGLSFRNLANYITRALLDTGGFRPRLHPHLR